MGGVGSHADHRADLAVGVQEPATVCEHRRDVQAAGSVAREACARVERGDAQHDGADNVETQGELSWRACIRLDDFGRIFVEAEFSVAARRRFAFRRLLPCLG